MLIDSLINVPIKTGRAPNFPTADENGENIGFANKLIKIAHHVYDRTYAMMICKLRFSEVPHIKTL